MIPSAEQSPVPYYQAARFSSEATAGRAYFLAHRAIFKAREQCDLSAYRFQLNRIYHVAVLGETPPEELDRRLRKILAAGELTSLPEDVLQLLIARRAQQVSKGPWTEGHYRPGKPFWRE